jgi:biotin carboxyl carrier protein
MKLLLQIASGEIPLELDRQGPLCRFRLGGGDSLDAEVAQAEPGVYSVLMNGRSFEARVEPASGGLVIVIDGRRFEIVVRDSRAFRRGVGRQGAEGVAQVIAPMPGRVVRVIVSAGSTVAAGQALLVVEAMKMQNELCAPRSGKVASISVSEGATVAAGEVLAVIE